MKIALKVTHVTEKSAEQPAATIKTACPTKDVSEELVDQSAVPTANAAQILFVRIACVKPDAEQIIRAPTANHVSTNNVRIHAQCLVNVDLVHNVTCSTMEFNVAVRKDCLEIHSSVVQPLLNHATIIVSVMIQNDTVLLNASLQLTVLVDKSVNVDHAVQSVTQELVPQANFAKEMFVLMAAD
jgi:hypothetical protein